MFKLAKYRTKNNKSLWKSWRGICANSKKKIIAYLCLSLCPMAIVKLFYFITFNSLYARILNHWINLVGIDVYWAADGIISGKLHTTMTDGFALTVYCRRRALLFVELVTLALIFCVVNSLARKERSLRNLSFINGTLNWWVKTWKDTYKK